MLETKPKPGSKLRCINTGGLRFLTKGNVYETTDGDDPHGFFFLDDDGDAIWHRLGDETEEFELVEEEKIMNNTTETKADEFKTGDVVWCLVYGKGEVGDILKDDLTYPMEVLFDSGGANWYTKEGRFSEEGNRTLFFSEPKIEASVTRPFVPTLVGKRVVVQEPACHDMVINVSWEDQDSFGNFGHIFNKDRCVAFEVSDENLLADAASGKAALK